MILIKNIIFDLGSVLLKEKPNSFLKEMIQDDSLYKELNRFFDDMEPLDLGNESLEDRFYQCNYSKKIEKEYKDILLNYYKYRKINLDLIHLINTLKENHYPVYILSDNNWECFRYYKQHELFNKIDGWVLSCMYHTCKRDGRLFDILLEKFHLKPSECYFIDDNVDNVNESFKHGIRGYVFNENHSMNDLYNDMKKYDISIK